MKAYGKRIATVLLLLILLASFPFRAEAEVLIADTAGENLLWELDEEGLLRISGSGPMPDWSPSGDAPWLMYSDMITAVEIAQGVTAVGAYAFLNCAALKSAAIPEGVISIGIQAFTNCAALTSVRIPESCLSVGDYAFRDCTKLSSVEFTGNAPSIGDRSFYGVTAAAYCSCLKSGWDENTMLQYGAKKLTWSLHAWDDGTVIREAACTEDGILRRQCAVCLAEQDTAIPAHGHIPVTDAAVAPSAGAPGWTEGSHCSECGKILQAQQSIPALGYAVMIPDTKEGDLVEIDGAEYTVGSGGKIVLAAPGAVFAVKLDWKNPGAADIHKTYPIGMQVFRLDWAEDGSCSAVKIPQLDNVLQYAGASIRITGNKGIRMITAIPEETRNKLAGSGIEGYVLLEYGTLVQWDSALNGQALTFAAPGVRSAPAYEKGKNDPIFARSGGKIQFTNVLVGFSDAQCGPDLAMRPYMKLKTEEGKTVILYGGTVHRSIGYIALQNENAFNKGTAAWNYIHSIIQSVYPG
jgi:hypothetical protein